MRDRERDGLGEMPAWLVGGFAAGPWGRLMIDGELEWVLGVG